MCQYVLPIFIIIGVFVMFKRAIILSSIYDWIIILISFIMLIIFVLIKQDQEYIHNKQLDIRDFNAFDPSNKDLVEKLKSIAMYHSILIICCLFQLLSLYQSYEKEE